MLLQWILPSCFLISAVLGVRAVLGKRISARFRYALWAVVLVRLLIPVQLLTLPELGDSPVMLQSAADRLEEGGGHALPVLSVPEDAVQEEMDGTFSAVRFAADVPIETGVERAARYTYANRITPAERLQLLWVTGGAVLAILVLAGNLHFYVRLRRMRKPLEGTGCQIPVYIVEHLPSPCLFGVLRPSVYVTAAAAENPVVLHHVLAHELTHFRHMDYFWSLLRGIALVFHWWNPLVWLAAVLSRRDGELACDEGALKRLGREERTAYGETLLSLVAAKPSPQDLLSCAARMLGEKHSLRERIRRISCEPKQFVSAAIAAALIVSLTSACAFGKPVEPEPPGVLPQQETEGADSESSYSGTQPVLPGIRKEGIYTFLIVGSDSSGNADTLMVVSYDTVNQDISVMSIPRDTAVNDAGSIDRVKFIFQNIGTKPPPFRR